MHACNDVKDTEKLSSRIDKSFGNPNKMKEVGMGSHNKATGK